MFLMLYNKDSFKQKPTEGKQMKIKSILNENDYHNNNEKLTKKIKGLVVESDKILDVILMDFADSNYVDIQVFLDDYRHPITREATERFECTYTMYNDDGDEIMKYRDIDPVISEIELWLETVKPDNLAKDEHGHSLYDHYGQWNGSGRDPHC